MEGMVALKNGLNDGIRMRPVEIGLEMYLLAVGFKFECELSRALPRSLIDKRRVCEYILAPHSSSNVL